MTPTEVIPIPLRNGESLTVYLANDYEYDRQKMLDGVVDGFTDRKLPFEYSGNRSILIDSGDVCFLKIKGNGFRDGPVIHKLRHTGPPYACYDFEGNKTVDIAMGHDNAFYGAMSWTQAYREFSMCRTLANRGIRCMPTIGWGKHDHPNNPPSYFSLHAHPRRVCRAGFGEGPNRARLLAWEGKTIARMHMDHGIVGFSNSMLTLDDDKEMIIDLHGLKEVFREDCSAITMTMYMSFGIIVELVGMHQDLHTDEERDFARLTMYREILPDATLQDIAEHYDKIGKFQIFMKGWRFELSQMLARLKETRVTRTMYNYFAKTYAAPYPEL